jgi:hypothetical protein
MVTCGRGGSDKTATKSAAPALPLSTLFYRLEFRLLAPRRQLTQTVTMRSVVELRPAHYLAAQPVYLICNFVRHGKG